MAYLTDDVVAIAKTCYKEFHGHCSGDCGSVKCFFCPGCVLSLEERVSNLRFFDSMIQKEATA